MVVERWRAVNSFSTSSSAVLRYLEIIEIIPVDYVRQKEASFKVLTVNCRVICNYLLILWCFSCIFIVSLQFDSFSDSISSVWEHNKIEFEKLISLYFCHFSFTLV